ncbi:alpha/beta hydrolase [Actinacidiphila oryziradicis]|uniref:alpha/beta hydrolase n=1 Tax=Actinacidiphila oryziradicis TaxID=2571141 RepID=UPI0026B38C90|nr:alpha/beta hydrolase [Actinacidiphila oryziradicis]
MPRPNSANGSALWQRGLQGSGAESLGPAEAHILAELLLAHVDARLAERQPDRDQRLLKHARAQIAPQGQAQGTGDLVRRLVNACTTLLSAPGARQAGQWARGRLMVGHLAQVARYLGRGEPDGAGRTLDRRIRDRVPQSLADDRSTVVVAHSLGTVVALEALHDHQGPVPLLITLGSPIGMRTVVQPRLLPQPLRTPEPVRRWLNFWDRDDIIVARAELDRDVKPNSSMCRPVSRRVDSDGVWVHTATKYLAKADVARR